jgi:hypothetical protein
MASILDDLKGILSPAEYSKLEANGAIKARIARGEEMVEYFDGGEPPATTTTTTTTEPPARTTPAGMFDLSSIERMLDARDQKQRDLIKTELDAAIKTRGDELYNNVRAGVRGDALQLVKIYTKHQQATGKEWDDAEEVKFNEFLKTNNEAVKAGGGKRYGTLTEAYNDYIAPVVTERTIESEVDKRVTAATKAQSGQHVPGTTPPPASNSNIRHFMKRSATGTAAETTGAGRAAAALDRIMSRRNDESAA